MVKFAAGGRTVTAHSKSDSFGRKVFDELQLGTGFLSRQFAYHVGVPTPEHEDAGKLKSSATTQLVSRITYSDGRTIDYEYDAEERITRVTDSIDGVTEYTYDAMGQLVEEKVDNQPVNTMEYDRYGNITKKNGVVYTYDKGAWKDRLTSYNGETITYDAQGNPTNYRGRTMVWDKGRQLKSTWNKNQTVHVAYTYNANGIRTSKMINGMVYTYTLDGTKILREDRGSSDILIPLYDNEDSVCGLTLDGTPYYFQKNLQGDVIAITDADGSVVTRYIYDAWGKCTVTLDTSGINISNRNPYRYRGYYYDSEIGMYYLQSRYYDPETGRFINADDAGFLNCFGVTASYNLFTYCVNTPTNMMDSLGFKATKLYSGVVGFGIQILLSANVLCYQGFFGVEGLWFAFTKNNNFGNGMVPWCYYFVGASRGFTLDFKKILSKRFLDNPRNVLEGLGLGFSISVGITFFLITAKKMKDPSDYTRDFTFSSVTTWGITVSKASGSNISTYGVGFAWEVGASLKRGISIGKKLFGTAKGASFYWALPINRNAKELYSLVKSKV